MLRLGLLDGWLANSMSHAPGVPASTVLGSFEISSDRALFRWQNSSSCQQDNARSHNVNKEPKTVVAGTYVWWVRHGVRNPAFQEP